MPTITQASGWSSWVVPRDLRAEPVHRWYVFPHSFTHELANALTQEWGLQQGATVLDTFVGAGTTAVACQQKGFKSVGLDISPLATFAARVKTQEYRLVGVLQAWNQCQREYLRLRPRTCKGGSLCDWLPDGRWSEFDRWWRATQCIDFEQRDLLRLFILRSLPRMAAIKATGGWCSKTEPELAAKQFKAYLECSIPDLMEDVALSGGAFGSAILRGDARRLPLSSESMDAVITSPPYPNRHDYTRVFGLELAAMAFDSTKVKAIRRQSLQSHPESRPTRHQLEYKVPQVILEAVARVRQEAKDPRVPNMIDGYFRDMAYCLHEIARVLKSGGRVALVVGNARYSGVPILVDEWTALVGEERGLLVEEIRTVRIRGNSAQQMGTFGREPSRESVVIFRKA